LNVLLMVLLIGHGQKLLLVLLLVSGSLYS
jgi:hypothetical protein